MASIPEIELTRKAAKIPEIRNEDASAIASFKLINPLGMGRSGRSIRSRSASNISLNTMPPPYNPKVERQSKVTAQKSNGKDACNKNPEMAIPARTSAIEVTMLAGRSNCK